MSLLWRSTHYRGRRKVEEYFSLEVPDSDNNSTKESVEFSEHEFYFGGAPTIEEEGRLKNILLQKSQIQTTILLKNLLNFAESLLEAASG